MSGNEIGDLIPGNVHGGVIRNLEINLSELRQKVIANEMLECTITGVAPHGYEGPNLISCRVTGGWFPDGQTHVDAKDTVFADVKFDNVFTWNLLTQCALSNVTFQRATLVDSVFVATYFEEVTFDGCDLSVATFKGDTFVRCKFVNCKTNNKLFEHCVFDNTRFTNMRMQENAILQNFGILATDCQDVVLYRAETGDAVEPGALFPHNEIERVSFEYFAGLDIDQSAALFDVVQMKFDMGRGLRVLHALTAVEQLARFLTYQTDRGTLRAYFLVQLFWSLDRLLQLNREINLPASTVERMQTASARLRPFYEEIVMRIADRNGPLQLLVNEEFSAADVQEIFGQAGLEAEVIRFERYNSPSIAELIFTDQASHYLAYLLVLLTKFKFEIKRFQPHADFLLIQGRLLGGQAKAQSREYDAIVALNLPGIFYMRLTAGLSLQWLNRLRKIIAAVLDSETQKTDSSGEEPHENQRDS